MTVTTLRCIWPPSDSVHIAGFEIVVCDVDVYRVCDVDAYRVRFLPGEQLSPGCCEIFE